MKVRSRELFMCLVNYFMQDLIILFAEVRKLKPLGSLSSYMEELGFDPRSV